MIIKIIYFLNNFDLHQNKLIMKIIIDYLLEWNITSKKGKVILKLEDTDPEIINNLDFQEFSALALVLGKGNARFDTSDNSIYNVLP